jgi:hypothetical protein
VLTVKAEELFHTLTCDGDDLLQGGDWEAAFAQVAQKPWIPSRKLYVKPEAHSIIVGILTHTHTHTRTHTHTQPAQHSAADVPSGKWWTGET